MYEPRPFDIPFFSLVYDPATACFDRVLPPGGLDFGLGFFWLRGVEFRLPKGSVEEAVLCKKKLGGKDILALVRRGPCPFVREGPVAALREDRLMELRLVSDPADTKGPPGGERTSSSTPEQKLSISLVPELIPREQWLPLEGLPNHRLCGNRVYEIMPPDFTELFSETNPAGRALTLSGARIPEFADKYARLIYVFSSEALYQKLSQDAVFSRGNTIRPIIRCESPRGAIRERGAGKPVCVPALEVEGTVYSVERLSARWHKPYLLLGSRWIRRETLAEFGIGPLGNLLNGEKAAPYTLSAKDFLSGRPGKPYEGFGGPRLCFASGTGWERAGDEAALFRHHLEFLNRWGISGGVITRREIAAAELPGFLRSLSDSFSCDNADTESGQPFEAESAEENRVLILAPSSFITDVFESGPDEKNPGAAAAGPDTQGESLANYAAATPGIQAESYGSYAAAPGRGQTRGRVWDILVVVDPNQDPLFPTAADIEKIPARLRLGIFFADDKNGERDSPIDEAFLKKAFHIPAGLLVYTPLIFRRTDRPLSFPLPPQPEARALIAPQKHWLPVTWEEAGLPECRDERNPEGYFVFAGARVKIDLRFNKLPVPALRLEQEEIYGDSGEAPFTALDENTAYRNFSDAEKKYFQYWRREFRAGRFRETTPAYIAAFFRELILGMDSGRLFYSDGTGEYGGIKRKKTFAELCRLRDAFRAQVPAAEETLSRWLLDFAVLYRVPECSRLFSPDYVPSGRDPFLADLFLHHKYIAGNSEIDYRDFLFLLRRNSAARKPGAREPGARNPWEETVKDFFARNEPEKKFGEALVHADRALRKLYGKKLLEFFYPVPPEEEAFTCFGGIPGIGHSSYTAERRMFSRHRPLIDFLHSLFGFIETRIFGKGEKRSALNLEPVWKYLCGLDKTIPPEMEDVIREQEEPLFLLEPEKIARLREESDAVLELLSVADAREEEPEPAGREHFVMPEPAALEKARGKSELRAFIETRDETSIRFIEQVSRGQTAGLDAFAREQGTMTELIIDTINADFLREYGDLLIAETMDKEPVIQEEYKDEVIWALTFRNG